MTTPADEGAREAEIQRWFGLNEWVELNCSSVITDRLDDLTTELAEARRERDEQRERKQVARDAFQVAVKDALDVRAQLTRANAVIERVGALSEPNDDADNFALGQADSLDSVGYTGPAGTIRSAVNALQAIRRTILEGNGA